MAARKEKKAPAGKERRPIKKKTSILTTENVCESIGKGARIVVTGRLEQRSWETENGDKRSVVEIVADDVGPSLRWATAEVTRN